MDALVMCGGRGTRLDAPVEKPLVEVCDDPMIDGVLAGLAASPIDRIVAAVSPHTPDTAAHLRDHPLNPTVFRTPGDGYVTDLQTTLERVDPPVVSVAADIPHLGAEHVERAIRAAGHSPEPARSADRTGSETGAVSVTVCVPVGLKRRLGASVDTTIRAEGRELVPTGLNVVGDRDRESVEVAADPRLAVNVNRPADVPVAEVLCG